MDGITLRQANAEDIADVAGLFARSRAVALPFLPVLHSGAEDIAFLAGYLERGLLTLAERDGRLLGFLAETPGWIEQLYLEPDQRGQGIGSRLVDAAKQRQNRLELWCFVDNHAGRAFYIRHGFIEIRRTDGDNEEKLPDILLGWQRPA
ncbi:GNAT family N-acetyltransferase [Devosia sp. SL43]|uniref:GNAT family N-acetyltransferase n=1 Tax=Devosia sp. SL43 TaxID=2806348 RepID=UPI001F310AC3|nr:GNAT family N-acetyltransferase [Devosia sp. SL43]UJW84192.1 GNAT family N-acetyltransferase [Devosia sp. SL43]